MTTAQCLGLETCSLAANHERMRLSDLNYKVYRGSSGATAFWRWEVFHKTRSKVSLKSGFVYGTMADAKKRASDAMLKLADTGKTNPQKKI
jgi:hypothetical protein